VWIPFVFTTITFVDRYYCPHTLLIEHAANAESVRSIAQVTQAICVAGSVKRSSTEQPTRAGPSAIVEGMAVHRHFAERPAIAS
jgi:hypothetical protein